MMATMSRIVYKVTLAVGGKHSVAVSGDDPVEVQEALAHAKGVYLKLQAFEGKVQADEQPEGAPPLCEIHKLPMVWQKGRKGFFWSCHQKDGDKWCSYKPNPVL
jgi:hypothetical protein